MKEQEKFQEKSTLATSPKAKISCTLFRVIRESVKSTELDKSQHKKRYSSKNTI